MKNADKPSSVPAATPVDTPANQGPAATGRLRTFLQTTKGRNLFIGAGIALGLGVVLGIPYTRYGLLGQIIKKPVTIQVQDSRTHKPVSDAVVSLNGRQLKADAKGHITMSSVPVGHWQLSIDKKYYSLLRTDLMVPLFANPKTHQFQLVAIGNQVTVKVTNKITGKVLAKASIAALGTTATTDANGEAVIVLPAKQTSEPGTIKLSGYNDLSVGIQNTETLTAANTFAITPSGKLYFLSKRTGKINVMKANLDGSSPNVIVAGTGKEAEGDTVLLATRDWRYLALKAKRDSDRAKLYLIDTKTDQLSVIDEGSVDFSLVGWLDHHFIYVVNRPNISVWQPKQAALKTFDANTANLATIDETQADGTSSSDYVSESINSGQVLLMKDRITYSKDWQGYYSSPRLNGKNLTILVAQPDGSNKQVLKEVAKNPGGGVYVNSRLYQPDEAAYQVVVGDKSSFYELNHNGLVATTDITADTFEGEYKTYVQSPSGQQTFWFEARDGKNSLFVGNSDGEQGREVASLSEFTPYGWYGDDYVLVSKNQSELYIASKDFNTTPFKITDYHRPNFNAAGYGGGYGGF